MRKSRAQIRQGVKTRIRRKVVGTAERPRIAVFRSSKHIYVQAVDDVSGRTLASASTTEKDMRGAYGGNVAAAKRVGASIAERLKQAGCETAVFDRGGYIYHGRVKALADAARETGLKF